MPGGRTRDYGLGEFTFPRGWFMVAAADTVGDGIQPVRLFGQDLVLYRGADSKLPVLLDAYCCHKGAHLAGRRDACVPRGGLGIEGDCVRCPFHGWRFGPDGVCNQIPYSSEPIPEQARIRSWAVVERLGAIFVWHDPEGAPPDWEVPAFPEWSDPCWVHGPFDDLGTLPCHPQEVLDNIVDAAHQWPVHGQRIVYFENEFSAHCVNQKEGGYSRTALAEDHEILSIDATYHGPGLLVSGLGGRFPSYFIIAHTPVEDGSVHVWHTLVMKSARPAASAEDVAIAKQFQAVSLEAFAQDFDLWKNKLPATRILQIRDDGHYHKLRQWNRQFYNPRARTQELTQGLDGRYGIRGVPTNPP